MTVVRYRCERHPQAGTARRSPVGAEVRRLARDEGVARSPKLSVPRTLARPVAVRNVAVRNAVATSALPAPTGEVESVPASSGYRAPRVLEGLTILIVEDNADARELVGIVLLNAGAVVLSAASAADGFHEILAGRPQLLVSDIGMPDEDGYSLMRRIRALRCCDGGDIPSMALSAFTRPEDRMLALRAGFTVHVAKPVHPSLLVSTVATLALLLPHRALTRLPR